MCGIIGSHTAIKQGFYPNDREQFKNMLLVTSLRGSHSTGVFGVDRDIKYKDEVNIIKTIGSPYMLGDWKMADTFFSRMISDFGTVVGHCRYATMGNISAETAHPFKEGDITLVHNGVINNYLSLKDKKHGHISVDSNLVAALFNEEGALEILPKLRGAYTLVWWDATDGSLNMARNKERPMFIAKHENKEHIMFASESETLEWNAARSKSKIDDVFELPAFNLYKFMAGSINPEVIQYKERYTYTPPKSSYGYSHHKDCSCWKCSEQKETTVIVESKDKMKVRHRPLTLDDDGEQALFLYKDSAKLQLGDKLRVDLDDYEQKNQVVMLYGTEKDFPNVEFTVTSTQNNSDQDLIFVDWIEGTVSSIYFVDSSTTRDRQYVRVYLQDAVGCYLEKDGSVKKINLQGFYNEPPKSLPPPKEEDDWIKMKNVDGDEVNINRFRFDSIADMGCAWCTGKITEYERSHPKSLIVYSDSGVDQFICQECSEGYNSYAARHQGGLH